MRTGPGDQSLRDPVTGFVYPDTWVDACTEPALLDLVGKGLAVLTSSGLVRKRGYTTGATTAAACKAAILSHTRDVSEVPLTLPSGICIRVPVAASRGTASARKYSGDYPGDVTSGMEIQVKSTPYPGGIQLVAGEGIGRFTRDTPRFRAGAPAISHSADTMIRVAAGDAVRENGWNGAELIITVPEGRSRSERTLNPVIGIQGGISLLGTTGLVEPWDDHIGESVKERIRGRGRNVVLVTGRIGLRHARLRFPDRETVLVGRRIGESLDVAGPGTILFGLPGLILRFIRPGLLEGTGFLTVEELSASPAYPGIQASILSEFCERYPAARIVIIDRQGNVCGEAP